MTFLGFLFDLLVRTSLLVGVTWGLTRILRRQSAALRHVAWVLTLTGVLLLPLAANLAPRVNLPVAFWRTETFQPVGPGLSVTPAPTLSSRPMPESAGPMMEGAIQLDRLADDPALWSSWILAAAWFGGFLWVTSRSLFGLWTLSRLRKMGTRRLAAEELSVDVPAIEDNLGLRRRWELRQNVGDEPASALTWGVRRPVVLVPSEVHDWSRQRQEAVLLHELAHVRRFDFVSQMLAEVACALYWFNPLVWLGARAMRAEAELAADDVVLRSGVRPSTYAEELLRIAAEIGHRRRLVTQPGIPVMNAKKIEARLESVLSPVARRGLTQVQVLAAVSLAALAIPAIAGLQATAPQGAGQQKAERTEALTRIKQAGLATIMYCQDYDDMYPYVQQTASVIGVTMPYVRDKHVFVSPTPGAKFLYNLNVGGVLVTTITEPANTPLWMESIPSGAGDPAFCFTDGHAKLLSGAALAQAKSMAAKHFTRPKNSKPLPKNYMIDAWKDNQPGKTTPATLVPVNKVGG